jgi:hypothetical protein
MNGHGDRQAYALHTKSANVLGPIAAIYVEFVRVSRLHTLLLGAINFRRLCLHSDRCTRF